MANTLQKLGFELFAIQANQSPSALRKALKRLKQRLQRPPQVTTFFFYYSGHADKSYFHMGAEKQAPFSYKELIHFFVNIQVRRRFAVIDACFSGEIIRQFGSLQQFRSLRGAKHLTQKGVVSRLVFSDLRKYLPDQGSRARGLQIISSSRFLSFESDKHKGSVFTFHFLRGLQGNADLDKDGKVSMNELFLYTKPRVKKETGQSPQQWLFREGGETYGFAPAYQSMLELSPDLQGKIQVSVNGFVWRWFKQPHRSLRLAISAGVGEITLEHRKRCFQGQMQFPMHGKTIVSSQLLGAVPCRSSLRSKSGIQLPLQIIPPTHQMSSWNLDFSGGTWFTSGLFSGRAEIGGGGTLGLRKDFYAFSFGTKTLTAYFNQQAYTQLLFEMRGDLGYRGIWDNFDLFVGAFLSVGFLLQDINALAYPSALVQFGPTLQIAYWLHEKWALSFSVDGAVLPAFMENKLKFFWAGSARLGIRWLF